jgi:hypothetical protein
MSDQHPRPWRVDSCSMFANILDADGDDVCHDIASDIADLIVAAVNACSPWISVEDRLPDKRGDYLVIMNYTRCRTIRGFAPGHGWWEEGASRIGEPMILVTHWMPLPEPPSA